MLQLIKWLPPWKLHRECSHQVWNLKSVRLLIVLCPVDELAPEGASFEKRRLDGFKALLFFSFDDPEFWVSIMSISFLRPSTH
mmetsp:Transcript_43261/g.116016  ORF Transcript_43261/g.116016 Transcript_43261/m.116016 type:complete len:83 (+) Transcript_43261:3-251(+)